MRFSLRWLFVAVLAIAICVVALLNANEYWVLALRGGLLLILSLSIVGGVFSMGVARSFWIGFAIFGWIYFLSSGLDYYPPFDSAQVHSAIHWVHSRIVRQEEIQLDGWRNGTQITGTAFLDWPQFEYFRVAAHCVLSALVATVGGYIAGLLYLRNHSGVAEAEQGKIESG